MRYPIGRLGDWKLIHWLKFDMFLCWTEAQEQREKMGEEQAAPTSPSHPKILQWFPVNNSINIIHTGI